MDLFYLMWCSEWRIRGIPVWILGNASEPELILGQTLERIIDCAQGLEPTSDCARGLERNHGLE